MPSGPRKTQAADRQLDSPARMAPVLFFIASIGAIAGAAGVVAMRNPFYSVLALVFHLLSLAALFLLLRAEFVAAAQVVVYAGAVMVLYVFVVSYIGGEDEPMRGRDSTLVRGGALLFAGVLFVELSIAVLGSGLKALGTEGAGYAPPASGEDGFGSPGAIGELLLTKFLFAFEAASFLLLMAAVGAVVLARRRGGLHSSAEQRMSVADFLLPPGTGTMREGASGLTGTPALEPGRELGGTGDRDVDPADQPQPTTHGGGW